MINLRVKKSPIIMGMVFVFIIGISQVQGRRLNLNKLDKSAAPEVIKCVQDKKGLDPEYRAKCIDLLGEWKEKSSVSAIEGVLSETGESAKDQNGKFVKSRDTSEKVRVAACYALGELTASSSVPVLTKTVKEDNNYEVRVAAAIVLRNFETEASVDGLIDALLLEIQKDSKADMPVVRQIIRSLGSIGHKKAFIPLLKATQVGFPDYIKEEAQQAIENIRWKKDFNSSSNSNTQ